MRYQYDFINDVELRKVLFYFALIFLTNRHWGKQCSLGIPKDRKSDPSEDLVLT